MGLVRLLVDAYKLCFFTHRITVLFVLRATLWRSAGFAVRSCRELVVAFGRPRVRLPEKPTSGLQYSCSDREFRLFVWTTVAPIDREEKTYIHIHMYIYIYLSLSLSLYIYIYIHTHTPTYTHTYIYIYIYIYRRPNPGRLAAARIDVSALRGAYYMCSSVHTASCA